MRHKDFGALVWRDGDLVIDTNTDASLFLSETGPDRGGSSRSDGSDCGRNGVADSPKAFDAVLGDGDIRVGISEEHGIVVSDSAGRVYLRSGLDDRSFIETFNVPDKFVICGKSYSGKPLYELYTKSWLDRHAEIRGHAKAMRNSFGARRAWFTKEHFRLYDKRQRVRNRKRMKLSSLHAERIPKGKVLLPSGLWFRRAVGGMTIYGGVDSFARTIEYVSGPVTHLDVMHRFAIELDGHWWTCRIGDHIGSGATEKVKWPEEALFPVSHP